EGCGQAPKRDLADGNFATHPDIEALAEEYPQTEVYAPVKKAKEQEEQGKDPYKPKRKDKPAVAAWRVRMGTQEAKAIYKRRAQTAGGGKGLLRHPGG